MFALFRYLVALLVFVAALALYLRNDAPVTVDLYTTVVEAPLALVLAASLALGLVVGYLVSLGRQWRLQHRAAGLERRLLRLKADLDGLQSVATEAATPPAAATAQTLALPRQAAPPP
jgi:uncharacterized membrane protein YciS (DUF1049 family)